MNLDGRSKDNLVDVSPVLVVAVYDAACHYPLVVTCGARSKEEQDRCFEQRTSRLRWPESKHNICDDRPLAEAVDLAPKPVNWNRLEHWYHFGGWFVGYCRAKGIVLRWGGDWDMDMILNADEEDARKLLNDLGHFELVDYDKHLIKNIGHPIC